MRCYICDAQDDNISYDHRDARFTPCYVCQKVIADVLSSKSDAEDDPYLIDEEWDNGQ